MHTPAVHALWEQSQDARQQLSCWLESCCGSFINSHQQLWQTAERATGLLPEVAGTDGATTEQNGGSGRHVVPTNFKNANLKILKMQPTGKWKNLTKRCGFSVVVDGRIVGCVRNRPNPQNLGKCIPPTLSLSLFYRPQPSGRFLHAWGFCSSFVVLFVLFLSTGVCGCLSLCGSQGAPQTQCNQQWVRGSWTWAPASDRFLVLWIASHHCFFLFLRSPSSSLMKSLCFGFFWTLYGGTYPVRILDFWSF